MSHPDGAYLEKMTEQRPDGAIWTHFLSKQSHIIITAAGRKLFRDDKALLTILREYRQDVVRARKSGTGGKKPLRQHFASGGNSDVYAAGTCYAVKEALSTQSLHSALDRMATIQNVMEKGDVPRWVNVPNHYGLVTAFSGSRQYMLLQKIDSGLTVEHVLSGGGVTEEQRHAADYLRARMRPGDEDLITDQYNEITTTVRHALEANGLDPGRYMPDWHQGNVVIEPTDVPVGGSRYKYWVIDQ